VRQAGLLLPGSLAILVMVLVAYLPALHAGYLWDDEDYVVHNSNLARPDGLRRIWFEPQHTVQYYPMVHTVLRAEYSLWRLRPSGYHLVNVLLHALNSILLWRILRRLAVPGAWLVACIFGLHPVHVESVAWITEIKNLLSGFFYFLSAWAYLCFHAARAGTRGAATPRAGSRAAPGAGSRARRFYALSLALFVLALLSKTTAVTLPAVLLVVVWWKTTALRRRDVLPLLPMFLLAIVCGGFVWWLETHHVGSEKVVALSSWERLLVPGRAAWFYARKLWWPANLTFIYPRWTVDPGVWWQWILPLGVLAVVIVLWLGRHRLGKGPLAAVLYFLLNLALVSGVVRFYFILYSFVGDHFQYLASIGIIALTVAAVAWCVAGMESRAVHAVTTRFVPALVLALLAVCTWNRAQAYQNEETLWRDTIAQNPAAWIAHNNLGVACMRQGRKEEARQLFATALQLNPDIPEAHVNLGALARERGDIDRAIAEYRQAVVLKPILVDAHYDLGVLLMRRGEMEEAARHFTAALQYQPSLADAHLKLGDIAAAQGQLDRALERYRAALAIAPANASLYYRVGWVFATRKSYAEARDALATAVRLNPADADIQALLGLVLEKLGDERGARERYGKALELRPNTDLAQQGMKRLAGGNGSKPPPADRE
jgi:tetratricopeptide (TPR) repeat protein